MRACDVAIVGGGLAGASLAAALAPLGIDIKVIEAIPFKAAGQPSYDDRTLVLSHSSCRILNGIGLWDDLEAAATAVKKIIVSQPRGRVDVILDPAELGMAEFGHVVEARSFGAVVIKSLARLDNVEMICPASVTGMEIGAERNVLHLQSGDQTSDISARLVVAADGANSFIRNLLRVPTQTRDYGQTAVICNITPEKPHQGRAFECLTESGPFAVLPHTGTRCGLVWTVPGEEATELLTLDEDTFLARAGDRFGQALGAFVKAGRRSAYPLRLVRAQEDIRERLVILGNAAHAIHPVGAQGFNLALRDVAVLAEILVDDIGNDPGNDVLLRQYSSWRQPDQRNTIAYSDGMTRLFAHPSLLAAGLRTTGFIAHALLPALRRRMVNRAMGYHGRVPRLALGESLGPL